MTYGWISHENPLIFDPNNSLFSSNGLSLFLCQVLIILVLCLILGTIFQKIGQPRVVGELLAGVVLGPTAFGNIPNFTKTIVPSVSLPLLSLTSNIGLILFILLVGLETDTDTIIKNAKKVALIAIPGMAIPFAISVGLANFVYKRSTDQSQDFSTFMLFVATVMAVTSLSVLSRIVSELQLVNTLLGSLVIAAGALNDLLGYILLALGSSLATKGRQINALYELLVALAMFLVQWFIVRRLMFWWITKKSNFDLHGSSKQRVPAGLMAFTILGAFVSAFITEACNLHPILGALLFGIACPHGNFAVMVTEAIEVVSVQILLPLYFVTSGLKADFKLLNSGLIWGELILIFAVVFISKSVATTFCTRLTGFDWMESCFVASLMQSKSIIELIILNAGREAGVLNAQVYSMLFVTFILSTLTVRPLSTFIWKRRKVSEEQSFDEDLTETSTGVTEKTDDEEQVKKQMTSNNLAGRSTLFPIITALTSINPAMEPLTALMQLAKQNTTEKGNTGFMFDIVRYLQNDNSASNILRNLNLHGDEVLSAAKMIAWMQNARLFSSNRSTYSDLVTTSSNENILEDLRGRVRMLNNGTPIINEETNDLGASIIVALWDKRSNLSFLQSDREGESVGRYDAMTNAADDYIYHTDTMATHLFNTTIKNTSTCVLVDTDAMLRSRGKFWHANESRPTSEEILGFDSFTHSRKPRVIVPFFGGADDRAAVQFAKGLASNAWKKIDVIVIKSDEGGSEKLEQEIMKSLQEQERNNKRKERVQRSFSQTSELNSGVEESNLQTVNLKTVNQSQERYADVRALFGSQSAVGGLEKDVIQEEEVREDDRSPGNGKMMIYNQDNVNFVNLNSEHIQLTKTKTTLEAILQFAAPLVNAQAGDMVFVGRGKWNQRRSNFRQQLNALQDIHFSQEEENLDNDTIKDVKRAGRVLGSCCEAVLSYGINASIMVIQSPNAQRDE
ncbi:hypothetical protein L7F22_019418 [Adiantum nelumboides]|nr:hypothetical protein [Adiantum nelumboides]